MNTTKLRKDLEAIISDYDRLEAEAKRLKTLLYRMVATHGNQIEPVPYLPRKGAKIHEMRVVSTSNGINFEVNHVEQVCPNNSEAEV